MGILCMQGMRLGCNRSFAIVETQRTESGTKSIRLSAKRRSILHVKKFKSWLFREERLYVFSPVDHDLLHLLHYQAKKHPRKYNLTLGHRNHLEKYSVQKVLMQWCLRPCSILNISRKKVVDS